MIRPMVPQAWKPAPGMEWIPQQARLQLREQPPSFPRISPQRFSSDGDWKHGGHAVSLQPGFLAMENFLHS